MDNEIIDFKKKGNVIRFYLGKNGEQWGDNWDNIPYEHNAEKVCDKYIKGYCDIAVDFDWEVQEPADLFSNSPYSKLLMRDRNVNALNIHKEDKEYLIYFGDKIENVLNLKYIKLLRRGGK